LRKGRGRVAGVGKFPGRPKKSIDGEPTKSRSFALSEVEREILVKVIELMRNDEDFLKLIRDKTQR
jgi:hypothetical protein